ncbi:MAG: ABC transporter permease, partial [Vulcanimicrobiaceae bacterium]
MGILTVPSQRWIDDAGSILIKVMIALAVLFLLMPLFVVVSMSFDSRDYLGRFPPPSLSLRWYVSFFSQEYLIRGLKTSLALASSCAIISTTIGVLAALGIEQSPRKLRDVLTSLFLSPLVVPGVVIGFALLLFYSRVGVENAFLRLLGGHIVITFPYTVRTALAAFGGIRKSVLEAA